MIEENWSAFTRIEKSGIIVARICQFEALFLIICAIFSLEIDIRVLLAPCNSTPIFEDVNVTKPVDVSVDAYSMVHRTIRKSRK
jgi:hypothetical protein